MGWLWNKSHDAPDQDKTANDTGQPKADQAKAGWWQRLKQGLKRTSDLLRTDIRDLLARREGELVDNLLDELYTILLRTDMGPQAARQVCDRLAEQYRGRLVTLDQLLASVKATFLDMLRRESTQIRMATAGPTVILVVGVNGSGKTTSIAKLAYRLQNQGYRVLLGAGDTFRAAAVEQLSIWAQRLGVPIVTGPPGSDPASVAHRAVAQALQTGADVCIVDTAGRLQTQVNLMEQLKKIRRVIQKQIPEAPHEVLLVLDATAGQNGISQAQGFSEAAGCTGIILAKLDGTAKGGVILPIQQRFQIPVKLVGVGEKLEDLIEFDPVQFVEGLFA
ncbi:MAG: signal recognition particle receptor FtsY [Pirellulaceae bacterium]|nr:MAG: signal recognition particle receptor FtsY [Pirellulaceae bacterium]